MLSASFATWIRKLLLATLFAPALLAPCFLEGQTQPVPVTVTVASDSSAPELPSHFLGLSYESSMLLPTNGKYYFDPNDQALINAFQTLGIKSLRVGANAVDDPSVAVPQESDIELGRA